MSVTDDDVKTRGQKELLDQIVSSSDGQGEQNNEAAENNSNEAESNNKNNDDDAQEQTTEPPANNGDSEEPPKVTREGTMVVTARVRVGVVCVGRRRGRCRNIVMEELVLLVNKEL